MGAVYVTDVSGSRIVSTITFLRKSVQVCHIRSHTYMERSCRGRKPDEVWEDRTHRRYHNLFLIHCSFILNDDILYSTQLSSTFPCEAPCTLRRSAAACRKIILHWFSEAVASPCTAFTRITTVYSVVLSQTVLPRDVFLSIETFLSENCLLLSTLVFLHGTSDQKARGFTGHRGISAGLFSKLAKGSARVATLILLIHSFILTFP